MASEYWDRFWRNRATRRRFLGTGAAFGAGAAGFALVGCGNDDDDDVAPPPDDDDDVAPPPDDDDDAPVGEGNYGGTYRPSYVGLASGDPPTLFPYENLSYLTQIQAGLHYSRLLTEYGGPGIVSTDYTVLEGDLAEALPEQPDDQTYIFRFRQNVHWHDKEPMNGAQANAEDFAETYQAFLALSPNAATYQDVIESLEATDEYTLEIRTSRPFAPFLTLHASTPEGVWFIPVRAIDGGQVHDDGQIGTGPWVFDRYDSGVSLSWNRNPNYFRDEGWPYYDRYVASLANDPGRIISALRAHELDAAGNMAGMYEELLPLDGTMHFEDNANVTSIFFNFDNEGGRWRDKRLRQALSMSFDRQAVLDAIDATGEGNWNSPFSSPNLVPHYLSPRDDDYGENGKYFQYDPAEARALLDAIGEDERPFVRINANVDAYGRLREQKWELTAASLEEAGWNVELNFETYGSYITSTYLGDIPEGVGYGPLIGSPRDPHDVLSRNHASTSARHNWGGTPIDEMEEHDRKISEQVAILDEEERMQFLHDFQREAAEYMLFVPSVSLAQISYHNPYVQNFYPKGGYAGHFTAGSRTWFTQERIDED